MWLALTLVSFAAFLVCAFALARLGFDREGALQRAGMPLLAGTALLLALWLFSLARVAPPYPLATLSRYEAPK